MTHFEAGDLVKTIWDDTTVWHVLQASDTQASIKCMVRGGGWLLDMCHTSKIIMHEKSGGLALNTMADKVHIAAMKVSAKRQVSYQDAMEAHGYQVDMDAEEMPYGYSWKMVFSKDGQVVYTSVFMQNTKGSGLCPNIGDCPVLKDLSCAEEDDVLKWRCRWRWADIIDCPEGPRYTPKVEDKNEDSH